MKDILLGLFIFISSFDAFSQNSLDYDVSTELIQLPDSSEVYLATAPITNRDYLTFLLWRFYVYEMSYPDAFIELFPGLKCEINYDFYVDYFQADNPITFMINQSKDYIRHYMFNVDYLDYPVLGLTWQQASLFNKWLGDRYNEYLLIQHGILRYNNSQLDEDSFVSEAVLYGMYSGYKVIPLDISKYRKDSLLYPSFRLPTRQEVQGLAKTKDSAIHLKSYKANQKEFLQIWKDEYFYIDSSGINYFNNIFNDGQKNSYKNQSAKREMGA